MLRSLYDFDGTHKETLRFKMNDYFILQHKTPKHKNWWEVLNERGEIGLVPMNYVERINVSKIFFIQFLEHSINYVAEHSVHEGIMSCDRIDMIHKLNSMKECAEESLEVDSSTYDRRTNSQSCVCHLQAQVENVDCSNIRCKNSNSTSVSNNDVKVETVKREVDKEKVMAQSHLRYINSNSLSSNGMQVETINRLDDKKKVMTESYISSGKEVEDSFHERHENDISDISSQSMFKLTEDVRTNTHLSYEMSRMAVVTVVKGEYNYSDRD